MVFDVFPDELVIVEPEQNAPRFIGARVGHRFHRRFARVVLAPFESPLAPPLRHNHRAQRIPALATRRADEPTSVRGCAA